MDIFFPSKSVDETDKEQLKFLTEVILPQIATGDKNNKIRKFFKESPQNNKKIIQFDSSYQNDFFALTRFNSLAKRQDHLKFFQSLTQEQKAAMSPYARLLLVPNPSLVKGDMEASSVPLSFSKAFDLDSYLNKNDLGKNSFKNFGSRVGNNLQSPFRPSATPIESTSRGELAALQSFTVNRIHNQTAQFEPTKINMNFYFSSFDVFAYKPAIEKDSWLGSKFQQFRRFLAGQNLSVEPSDLRYTELIALDLPKKPTRLVLEYGWNVSPTVSSKLISPNEKALIEKFEKSYFMLSPQEHNINFNEDGSFTLSVEYETVEYESLKRTSDFKANIYKNRQMYKIIKAEVKEDLQSQIDRYYQLEKEIKEQKNVNKRIILETQLSKVEKELNKVSAKTYVKIFEEYFKKNNLIYRANYKSTVDSDNSNATAVLKISDRANERSVQETKTYDLNEIKKKIKKGLEEKKIAEDEINLFIDDSFVNAFKKLFTGKKESVDFILTRDLASFISDLSGTKESPHIVFDNIALQKEDGGRYWCNLGDIPIPLIDLKTAFLVFLKAQPNANLIDLMHYVFQDLIPKVLSPNDNSGGSNPQISFPRVSFDFLKWQKNNSVNKDGYKKLFNGDKKYLKEFSKEYCAGTTINGSGGCLVVTQTPSLNFANSKMFIGKNVKIAEQTFFNDETKLLQNGIMRLVVGSSDGVLQTLNFNSNKDPAVTNIAIERRRARSNTPQSLLQSAFQYSLSATLFGNRAYDFTNLVYIPAAGIGYSPRIDGGSNLNYSDFQLGGLYLILTATDTMNLESGVFTKTINASSQKMESELLNKNLKAARGNTAVYPNNEPNISLPKYFIENYQAVITSFSPNKLTDKQRAAALEASAAPRNIEGGKQVDSDGVIRSTSGFAPLKTGIGSSF